MEPNETRRASVAIDWGRAITAGLVATIVITITMALFGQNIMMLGGMLVPQGSTAVQYLMGGVMHLAVGLFYGIVYAWLLGPVVARGAAIKGVLYGLALTGIALALMPAMTAMMGGGAANPCNPCASSAAANPCNPCGPAGQGDHAANPCNPCSEDGYGANPCNPCNPCAEGGQAGGPCNPCATGGPCNPCGGGGSPWSGLISLLNHVVYGLALALVYGRR